MVRARNQAADAAANSTAEQVLDLTLGTAHCTKVDTLAFAMCRFANGRDACRCIAAGKPPCEIAKVNAADVLADVNRRAC